MAAAIAEAGAAEDFDVDEILGDGKGGKSAYATPAGSAYATPLASPMMSAAAAKQKVAAAKPQDRTHKVASGESLWSIAQKHNVTVADLRSWNSLRGNTLKPGQRLTIKR